MGLLKMDLLAGSSKMHHSPTAPLHCHGLDTKRQYAQQQSAMAMKVVAICGSLRKASNNAGLVRAAVQIAKDEATDMEIEVVPIEDLPLYNSDLEQNGRYPDAVETFRARISEAHGFLFASPEYNYSVTAPLKNALDWGSRTPNLFAGKGAAVISAGGSFGGGRSQLHIRQIAVFLDLHFINKPELTVKAFEAPRKFDADGNLVDPMTHKRLNELLFALYSWILRLK